MAPSPAPWAVLGDAVWCLGLGCALGFWRDAMRLALGEGALRRFVRDVALFAAAAVLVCGFAAGAGESGLARWYMSAAVFAGALAWRGAVQPAAHRCAAIAAKLLLAPLHFAHRRVMQPVQCCLHAAFVCRTRPKKAKKAGKTKKSAEKQLQKPSTILYN